MSGAPLPGAGSAGPAKEAVISLYQAQQRIHPRSVQGVFARWRWACVWITQAVFYGLPWLNWGERPAVLFDLDARRFYILNLVLYPQDFIYLTGLLVVAALSLFLFTAVAGRLWCGYACPQSVYTEIFMWIEKLAEGDRAARIRLDRAPWSVNKLARRSAKQLMWLAVAGWTGLTFVGYFVPIRALVVDGSLWAGSGWVLFWVVFYGFATYGNAGYMREQVCKYMCPYARFQSAMFDRDTLIVTYDSQRGEPRGLPTRTPASSAKGDCVDCGLCVQVCPTGIDIRKGLQYECIGCGACADVCDQVMDKVSRPKGLVRYTTQAALAEGLGRAQIARRLLRPRVLVYTFILLSIVMGLAISLALRTPYKVDIMRDRGAMARMVAPGVLENVYRVQIMNATEQVQSFTLKATGLDGLITVTDEAVQVDAAAVRAVPLRLQLPADRVGSGSHPIEVHIQMQGSDHHSAERTVFLVPR